MNKDLVYIIVPVYNEARFVEKVIRDIHNMGYNKVVMVDDGSTDGTGKIGERLGVVTLRHRLNLGVGAATQTGIDYALEQGAEVIVTFDGDGQHVSLDIPRLIEALDNHEGDLVIGNRFMNQDNKIPRSRIFYNRIANLLSFVFTGVWVSDSQSGLKAMTRDFAESIELHWNGFEFCIEQIQYARMLKAKIVEVGVQVRYTRETMRKGQNLLSGFRTLANLIKKTA